MKKRLTSLLLALVMVMSLLPTAAFAAEAATEVADQQALSTALTNNEDILLTADLTLTEWVTPTGPYTGTLDGNGHKISGQDHVKDGRTGMLLSTIGEGGVVRNLTIDGASVGGMGNVGALAAVNHGTVQNVHLSNSQIYSGSNPNVGGLIGLNDGTVSQCSNQGGSTGVHKEGGVGQIGGIVGSNEGGLIDQCYNVDAVSSASGAFHGEGFAGGIAGANGDLGVVVNCYNRGTVSKGTMNSGGLVGSNTGVSSRVEGLCVNTYHAGAVIGGGNNVVTTSYGHKYNNWYDDANPEGAGHPDTDDKYSPENAELATALNVPSNFFVFDGGALKLTWETGKQPAVAAPVDKTELSSALDNVSGLTQESGPYTDASWLAFTTAQENAKLANAYPYATAEQVAKVTTALNTAHTNLKTPEPEKPPVPEIIYDHQAATEQELKDAIKAGGSTQLTADITLSDTWDLGFLWKTFTLDGAGHTITLTGAPLFGDIDFNCTVQNLVLAGKVNGKGAIASNNMGTIRNCVNHAAVTGIQAGGLVGVINSRMENCVNYGTVTMAEDPDGLPNYIGSLAGTLADREGVVLTGCYGVGEKLLGKGTADTTNHLLTPETDLNTAVEALNASTTVNDVKWSVQDGKLVLGTGSGGGSEGGGSEGGNPPVDPSLTVVEIANETALYNALADLTDDFLMETQKGKKLVITADFTVNTLANRFPPRGLNTVLDGQGHTITLTGAQTLIDEIGTNGIVKDLGIKGAIKGNGEGAFTNKCAGTIVNCWSTLKIERTDAGAIGGLVGRLEATGVIDNCFVAVEAKGLLAKVPQIDNGVERRLVGPLVGKAYEGCTIKNSYWAENMAEDGKQVATPYSSHYNMYNEEVAYTAPGCSVKVLNDMKLPAFVELLNANHGANRAWVATEAGFPVHGEAAPQPSVNKDALNAKINEVNGLKEADYTTDSWAGFTKALADAKAVAADQTADQTAVDNALTALTNAHSKLVKKPADLNVVEISNSEQFKAAMSKVYIDESMPDHAGKKFVITADFTYDGAGGLPMGLNTILDGQGHTITLNNTQLVNTLGPKAVVMNLGLIGNTDGGAVGAFADKSSGKIINCWSTANVKNEASSTIGGLVGTLNADGSIENSFVAADVLKGKNVGALVGTVRPNSTITNCYGKQGNGDNVYFRALDDMNMSFEYTGATGCAIKADAELKAPEFLALLNQNRGNYAQWTPGPSGYPHQGEASTVDPTQGIDVTLTYFNGTDPLTFSTADGLNLTTMDIMGMEIKLGTLSCENGAHWAIDYDTYGKDIMVGDTSGELYIYKPSTSKVTVSDSNWKPLASFTITVTESTASAIRMTTQQGEMVSDVLTVPGRTTINFVPQVQVDGQWKSANPALFTFAAPLENAEVVGSSVTPIKPGKFTVTITGMGKEASQLVESTYAPITEIKPAPSGEFIIHGRQAMVFEKKADFLDLNLSHQTGTVFITPSYATNQGKDAYTFSFSDPKVADYMADFVMGIRPLRAGTTDITVTTTKEEHNVSGTTTVTFKYKNPLTSIEYPTEVFEAKNGEKIDLPLVLHGQLESEGWHVTEPEIDWTYESSDGGEVIIARDGQSIQTSLDSVEKGLWYASDHFTIEGISAGTVKVTGTPWDTTGGAQPFTFTVKVTGEGGPAVDHVQMAKDDAKSAGDWIIQNQNGEYGYNSEWEIFSLLRNGRTVGETGIDADAYLNSVKAAIENPSFAKLMKKPTEMARIILAVTALGKDATDVLGINLIDRITKSADADMMAGSNESVWTLIALNTIGYEVPADAKWTREALINEILRFEVATGGFGLFSNEKAGVDTTGMAIQSLAPYYSTNAAVKSAVDKSLDYLRSAKDASCGYGNSESTAQVLTALAALKIDPLNASNGFTVGRKNLITNLDSYKTSDGGFAHMTNSGSNGMAAYQTLYALEAFLRYHDYKAPLYDLSDIGGQDLVEPTDPDVLNVIQKINAIGTVTLESEAAITAARTAFDALTPDQQKQVTNLFTLKAAEKRLEELKKEGGGVLPSNEITVTFKLLGAEKGENGALGKVWIPTTFFTMKEGDRVLDLFRKALDRAGLKYVLTFKDNYVHSIFAPKSEGGYELAEFDNGPNSGWMYTRNGIHPQLGLKEQVLSDGDTIVWHYVNDYTKEEDDGWNGGGSVVPTPKPEVKPGDQGGVQTEIKPQVKPDKNGNAKVEISGEDIKDIVDDAQKENTDVVVIKPEVKGKASKVTVELPKSAVEQLTKNTKADLAIDTGTAKVTLSPEAMKDLVSQKGKTVAVTVETVKDKNGKDTGAARIEITVGDQTLDKVNGSVNISMPTKKPTAGTVMVMVDENGKETVVKKSLTDGENVLAKLPGSATIKVKDNAKTFNDTDNHWAKDAIDFASSHELFGGTGENTFAPDTMMTRGMLATVLWRLEDESKSTTTADFQDVEEGQWYTEAINWAAENKIVNGYGDSFAPNDSITRQQLAAMLYRYADMMGLDMTATKDTTGFRDHKQIADWAADAMNWAVSVGLMNGKGDNQLDPDGNATRAEVATMCQRMMGLLVR